MIGGKERRPAKLRCHRHAERLRKTADRVTAFIAPARPPEYDQGALGIDQMLFERLDLSGGRLGESRLDPRPVGYLDHVSQHILRKRDDDRARAALHRD